MTHLKPRDENWLERVESYVCGLKYGTVQITVHDGKIVQIDRTERTRFDAIPVSKNNE